MTIINPADWTADGNITANNGLVAIKDGVSSKTRAQSAQNAGSVPLQDRYKIKATFAAPREVNRVVLYGPSDNGMYTNPSDLKIHVKAGNPLQLIGTHTFAGVIFGPNQIFEVTNFTPQPATDYEFRIEHVIGDSSIWVAQVELYEGEGGPPPPLPSGDKPLAMSVVIGQSNPRGTASPIPDQSIYPNKARVKNFSMAGQWIDAVEPLVDDTGTLWPEFNGQTPLASFVMPYGDALAGQQKNFDVGLVVCAKGNTPITEFVGTLFPSIKSRILAAHAAAPAGSFVAVILFQQGEFETTSEAGATAWFPIRDTLIEMLRNDLDIAAISLDKVAFVTVGLATITQAGYPAADMMRFAQQFAATPENCGYVKTFDLPNGGGTEWTNVASLKTIGERAATVAFPTLPKNC